MGIICMDLSQNWKKNKKMALFFSEWEIFRSPQKLCKPDIVGITGLQSKKFQLTPDKTHLGIITYLGSRDISISGFYMF